MKPTIKTEDWETRIKASRRRREQWEQTWSQYARLHTNAYLAVKEQNDDANVTLPSGDQVKVSLVFRNIEQTMGLLEVPEIGIQATATDSTRELGREDTHREAIVESTLVSSMKRSGLIKGNEEADYVKRDGVIIGHGVNYTYWRMVEREVEGEPVQVMVESDDGGFEPLLDEDTGEPVIEIPTEKRIVYEAPQDRYVSPLQFLFDASERKSIRAARWHGMEDIVKLDDLKQDVRYRDKLPRDIEPTSFKVKDLYGVEENEEFIQKDSVRIITVWDKIHYELLTFIEYCQKDAAKKKGRGKRAKRTDNNNLNLKLLDVQKWPIIFSHPDDSPFSVFVPIPANDHPFGISQIEHIRNNAVEADKLRTRQANLTRQIKRIMLYTKGKVDPDQVDEALKSPDFKAIGVDKQDGEEWKDVFFELPIPSISPEIFQQQASAEDDVRKTSGTSETPFGGASTATESDNMMMIGAARPNRKRRLYLSFLNDVANRHLDFHREFSKPGQTLRIYGADGQELILNFGREAFAGSFDLEVLPGGEAMAMSPIQQKMLVEVSNMFLGRFGEQFDRIFARQILTKLNIRDINAMLQAMQPMMGEPPAAGGRQESFEPGNYTNGQAIREAVNAANEGAMT